MKRVLSTISLLAVLAGPAGQAVAADGPLVGTWSFSSNRGRVAGSPESGNGVSVFFDFSAQGRFRQAVVGAIRTEMSGTYELSPDRSSLRLDYVAAAPLQICIGGNCAPNTAAIVPGSTLRIQVRLLDETRLEWTDASGPILFVRAP